MLDFIEIIQSHVINIKHLTIIEFPGFMTQLKWETLKNLVDLDIELIEDEDDVEIPLSRSGKISRCSALCHMDHMIWCIWSKHYMRHHIAHIN